MTRVTKHLQEPLGAPCLPVARSPSLCRVSKREQQRQISLFLQFHETSNARKENCVFNIDSLPRHATNSGRIRDILIKLVFCIKY